MPGGPITKRDTVVDDLRRRILSGELPRGARLPQDELARHYAASITPVREALRLLEAEGLLVSEPHRGARVAGVDLDRIKATYVVRRLVETYAMQRATTRMTLRDLTQARATVARMAEAARVGDVAAFRADNRAFHFFLYERCGMPGLTQQIVSTWQSFPWDLMLDDSERIHQSHREHVQILEALEGGDPAEVAAATEAHIAQGFLSIAARFADDGPLVDPFDLDAD